MSRLGDMIVIFLVAQVLVERSRIIVFGSSAGAIASSSLQIITGSAFRVNVRRRGGGIAKGVIIIMVVLRFFL